MKHLSYNVVNTTIECYIHFLETFAVYAGEEEDDSAVHHVFDYQDYLMNRRTRNFA